MSNVIPFKAGMQASIAVVVALLCAPVDGIAQTAPSAQRPPALAKPKPDLAPAAATPSATQGVGLGKAGNGEVVAQVGNFILSSDDVRGYFAALGPREQAAFAQDRALLSQAVRLLLANHLVLQEVQDKKWDQRPSVTTQLERVRKNALVELYLQSVAAPPAGYPGDEELQKVYDANRGAFLMPRQFQLTQIFIPLAKDADSAAEDAARKRLDHIQRKLKGPGADFAAVANENAARNGSDLGWVVENQIRPEIRTQILGLAKGVISDPVRLNDGWHVLKLIDTKPSYTRTLPEVREQLVQQMRAERAKVLRQGYLEDLMRRNPPVLNEIALSKVFSERASASR